MNKSNFKALIKSLKDLTPTQKRYLLNRTKIALNDESKMLHISDILTPEELDALLPSTSPTNTK